MGEENAKHAAKPPASRGDDLDRPQAPAAETHAQAPAAGERSRGALPGASAREAGGAPARWTKRGAAARRAHIVDVAAELVLADGAGKLTHRRVAAAAGVPLGSTTQYFGSIEELRREALEAIAASFDADTDELVALLDERGIDAETLADDLCAYFDRPDVMRKEAMLYRAALVDPDVRELFIASDRRFVDAIAKRCTPDQALLLSMLYDGASVHACIYDEPLPRGLIVKAMRAVLSA